jgi:hypothetical protein
VRWDHISLGGRRCEVVLSVPDGQRVPEANWTGETDMPFTRGLSRLALDLMLEGATMTQICRMLELPVSDFWKFKFRLDQVGARAPQGRAGGEPLAAAQRAPAAGPVQAPTAPGPRSPLANAPVSASAHAAAPPSRAASGTPAQAPAPFIANAGAPTPNLPAAEAPVWLALLKGQLPLNVQALSLKLLLSKLQREAQQHNDADLHHQAAQSLHQYFRRNGALLAAEIKQLALAPLPTQAERPGLPDVTEPLWLDLLTGQRDLDVRTLSLRLLLSKLRGQARGLQDDELRMLKLVELHRYFEKNQAALRHEIAQLHHWASH